MLRLLYQKRLLNFLSYLIVCTLLSCYREISKILIMPLLLLCLSKCHISVPLFKYNILILIAKLYLVRVLC